MQMVAQSRAPRLPSVWDYDNLPCASAPRRWALGVMTPRRKLASRAYFPGPRARLATEGDKYAYWHVMDYTLTSRQSQDSAVLPDDNFVLMALMASTDQAGDSFRSQFFQVVDAKNGFRWSRVGVNFTNLFGSGQNPFFLRRPYPTPNRRSLLNRSANLTTNDNAVQIVLYGVKD